MATKPNPFANAFPVLLKSPSSIMLSSSLQQQQQPQSPPSLVGAWLCQISSGLRDGRRRGGRAEVDDEQSSRSSAAAGQNKALREEAKASSTAVTASCRCRCAGEVMPEATVCLLLDRFAPS